MPSTYKASINRPLAERLRPKSLQDVLGQTHILSPGQPLLQTLEKGQGLHSMILWGPPGTGKTTLAKILCQSSGAVWHQLSAVSSGVKEIRHIVQQALENAMHNTPTVLFIDEVHRFNKSQQDTFLPYVEDGTITLIGATTENPAFELNNALLSRTRVYVLKLIDESALSALIDRALKAPEGLGKLGLSISDEARALLARSADGDARRVLGFLETAADLSQVTEIDLDQIKTVITQRFSHFDKGGDHFYDQISALHKAIRGSSPDAALYWANRMLQGGCDPHYLLRRLLRMASEDVGNADPRAMGLVSDAWQAYDRLGSPEGELSIMQAISYLAVAPKSNAVYMAAKLAASDAKRSPSAEVPIHLRNAPTKLAKAMDHGADYRYSHDEAAGFSPGQVYFPETLGEPIYYQPVARGLEIKIGKKLDDLRAQNRQARQDQHQPKNEDKT